MVSSRYTGGGHTLRVLHELIVSWIPTLRPSLLPNRLNDSPVDDRLESVIKRIILLRLSTRRSNQLCYAISILSNRPTDSSLRN